MNLFNLKSNGDVDLKIAENILRIELKLFELMHDKHGYDTEYNKEAWILDKR
jgi:hypothetical protein